MYKRTKCLKRFIWAKFDMIWASERILSIIWILWNVKIHEYIMILLMIKWKRRPYHFNNYLTQQFLAVKIVVKEKMHILILPYTFRIVNFHVIDPLYNKAYYIWYFYNYIIFSWFVFSWLIFPLYSFISTFLHICFRWVFYKQYRFFSNRTTNQM